jgi:2-succinyl-6-hydroxy-2,4-cyclohexadiene-1-carboxylate synthase
MSWMPLLESLSKDIPDTISVLVDLPGHGDSTDVVADLCNTADLLVDAVGPATYIGYSLGARVVLHAAFQHPDRVENCILISGTAGIEDERERAARRASDDALAERVFDIGTEAFIDQWLGQPMFASLSADVSQRTQRLVNTPQGLANSLRTCGTGVQEPLWDRLNEFPVPSLLIVGSRDDKFRMIAERMHRLMPASRLAVIEGAGHSAHLEMPGTVALEVARWLTVQH